VMKRKDHAQSPNVGGKAVAIDKNLDLMGWTVLLQALVHGIVCLSDECGNYGPKWKTGVSMNAGGRGRVLMML
jgi:hypothetical protein